MKYLIKHNEGVLGPFEDRKATFTTALQAWIDGKRGIRITVAGILPGTEGKTLAVLTDTHGHLLMKEERK